MPKKMIFTTKRYSIWLWLWVSVVVIVLDRLSKWWALQQLPHHAPVPVMPFFNFYLDYNQGAAFSFLKNAGGWQRGFLTAVSFGMSLLLILWLRQLSPRAKWLACSITLILGGALGNGWDRLYTGNVVDFIQLYAGNYYWPTFNIADSAICVGAVMLGIHVLFGKE